MCALNQRSSRQDDECRRSVWYVNFGIRKPSLTKRFAARTSWKRYVRHNLGFNAPRGWGWLTNPKKAAHNRVYDRTSFSLGSLLSSPRRTKRVAGRSTSRNAIAAGRNVTPIPALEQRSPGSIQNAAKATARMTKKRQEGTAEQGRQSRVCSRFSGNCRA